MKTTIMIFVESENGFGHFNVVDQLAGALSRQGCETIVVSGSLWHAGQAFRFGHATTVELPVSPSRGTRPALPEDGFVEAKRLERESSARRQAVHAACRDFRPSLILFEIYPFRMLYRDHDRHALDAFYAERGHRPPVLCLSRDIVFSIDPAGTVSRLNDHFDRVIVRGDGSANELADCMPEFSRIEIPVEYLGSIVAPMPQVAAQRPGERPIVVFAGGGHRAGDDLFLTTAILSKERSDVGRDRPWHLFVSANCPDDRFRAYASLAAGHGIDIHRPWPNRAFKQLLASARAAIIRGGYNSTHELMRAGVPFVTVPRESLGSNEEQAMRARLTARAGYGALVCEDELNGPDAGARLADALDRIATRPGASPEKASFDGAERIAGRLRELACQARLPAEDGSGAAYDLPRKGERDPHAN